ncbi:MAG: ferritin family protein [Lachnospiraceae bacterium]
MRESNDDFCNVSVDLPYPPIQPESHRPEYAYAMLSNVGSSNSEMSAISLYFYNSVILNPDYTNFARCFHKISIVEMHHLDIFAELAFQMGLDPRLWSMERHRKCYWTPAYNYYPQEIREVIKNSLKGEEAAIQKYTRQAEIICDQNIIDILNRIIIDEKRHVEIFNTMLEQIV